MKFSKANLLFIIINCILLGCKSERNKLQSLKYSLDPKEEWFALSEFADSIYYIPIKCSNKIILSNNLSFKFQQNHFLIWDRETQRIHLFERSGQFLRTIGDIGRSGQEYQKIHSFDADENNQRIFILDRGQKMIQVYDYDGNHIRKIPLPAFLSSLIVWQNKTFLIYTTPQIYDEPQHPNMLQFDYEGNELFRKTHPLPFEKSNNEYNEWYWHQDKLILRPGSSVMDTLYYIDAQLDLQPYLVMDFEGKPDKHADIYNHINYILRPVAKGYKIFGAPKETTQYLFFSGTYDQVVKRFMIDKTTGQSYDLRYSTENRFESGIRNDLDGGPPFFPNGAVSDDVLYQVVQPSYVKDYFNKNFREANDTLIRYQAKHELLKRLVAQQEIAEDPIIILIKMR